MTTTKLVSIVAQKAKVTRKTAAAAIKSLTAAIHESLKKVGMIRVPGLGTFRVSDKKARTGVNPRTREKIDIPATKSPRFIPSKALKDEIKAGEQAELALDVRGQVERLCREGDVLAGFEVAMKALIKARQVFGNDDLRTAGCMITVADAAVRREKFHLAGVLYGKALSIREKAFGPSHPDVVLCRERLSSLPSEH